MEESQKITIIEGPAPTFVLARDAWLLGLVEGCNPYHLVQCCLRAFNGAELVERCHQAWRNHEGINLEYRGNDDLTHLAPIVAARWTEVPEGDVVLLWLRLEEASVPIGLDLRFDDLDDELDDDFEDGLDVGDLDVLG